VSPFYFANSCFVTFCWGTFAQGVGNCTAGVGGKPSLTTGRVAIQSRSGMLAKFKAIGMTVSGMLFVKLQLQGANAWYPALKQSSQNGQQSDYVWKDTLTGGHGLNLFTLNNRCNLSANRARFTSIITQSFSVGGISSGAFSHLKAVFCLELRRHLQTLPNVLFRGDGTLVDNDGIGGALGFCVLCEFGL
jgi:hypothetical protein